MSLEVFPTNPSTADTVKLIILTSFGSAPSNLFSSSVTIDNDTINMSVIYS
jgi:hypothetical protein